VSSTHMRCMITENRLVRATIGFLIPRCRAIFMAQTLSQDHFAERTNMIWAAGAAAHACLRHAGEQKLTFLVTARPPASSGFAERRANRRAAGGTLKLIGT
jgi:hypothetical protein